MKTLDILKMFLTMSLISIMLISLSQVYEEVVSMETIVLLIASILLLSVTLFKLDAIAETFFKKGE